MIQRTEGPQGMKLSTRSTYDRSLTSLSPRPQRSQSTNKKQFREKKSTMSVQMYPPELWHLQRASVVICLSSDFPCQDQHPHEESQHRCQRHHQAICESYPHSCRQARRLRETCRHSGTRYWCARARRTWYAGYSRIRAHIIDVKVGLVEVRTSGPDHAVVVLTKPNLVSTLLSSAFGHPGILTHIPVGPSLEHCELYIDGTPAL